MNKVKLESLHSDELSELRNKEIGFVFQFHQLLQNLRLWKM